MNLRFLAGLAAFVCMVFTASGASAEIASLFPEMDGWEPEGRPQVYKSDNLFQYIDGSADLYLDYNFREMATLSYFDSYGRNVIIEVYDQGDLNSAYGIYSQEKPAPANVVEIGAEGYYDTGLLNFFRSNYYVKIQGFDLADQDEAMLTVVGKIVSQKIGGEKQLPPVLDCFPGDAKVRNSERFIAGNVFGHAFLHSAFVAQYRSDRGTNTPGLIIVGNDAADADAMLAAWVKLVEDSGGTVDDAGGLMRFTDPVSQTLGTVTIKKKGAYIWGLSTTIEETGAAYVAGVETNLRSKGLFD